MGKDGSGFWEVAGTLALRNCTDFFYINMHVHIRGIPTFLLLLFNALVVFLVSYIKLTEILNVVSGKQMVSQKNEIKRKTKTQCEWTIKMNGM